MKKNYYQKEYLDLFLRNVLLIPNLLSLSRILILPFLIYYLSLKNSIFWYSLILFLLVILSDILDGLIARFLNQENSLGKILDPIADKIVTFALGFSLVLYKNFPLWYLIILIFRDIIIVIGGLWIYKIKKIIPTSSLLGKIHSQFLGILSFFYIFQNEFYRNLEYMNLLLVSTLIICLCLSFISLIIYTSKFLKIIPIKIFK